eukprot:6469731-Amphidinium_carterae.1
MQSLDKPRLPCELAKSRRAEFSLALAKHSGFAISWGSAHATKATMPTQDLRAQYQKDPICSARQGTCINYCMSATDQCSCNGSVELFLSRHALTPMFT